MNSTVERTLYVILLLVFIGVGIAVYVAISFGAKLDQQLKDAAEQRTAQTETINQLTTSVEALKQDNAQQTEYIRCLLTAHNLGQYDVAHCATPNISGKTYEQLQPDSPPNPPNVATSPPSPAPSPSLSQKLGDLLKKIGL